MAEGCLESLSMKERVLSTFADSATVKQQFAREHADRIVQVVKLMANLS